MEGGIGGRNVFFYRVIFPRGEVGGIEGQGSGRDWTTTYFIRYLSSIPSQNFSPTFFIGGKKERKTTKPKCLDRWKKTTLMCQRKEKT